MALNSRHEMQQIVNMCEEPLCSEFLEYELESELPLALRLRRSWSCGDIEVLRKECEDDFVMHPECTSDDCANFIDDNESTCADGASSISGETVSSRLDWAEEMQSSYSPESCDTHPNCATQSASVAAPPGQWSSTLGKLEVPLEKAPETSRNVASTQGRNRRPARAKASKASANSKSDPKSDLVKSVKSLQRSDPEAWFRYTTEHGENIRDPNRHTEQFLQDFLNQYTKGTPAASAQITSGPPGKLASFQQTADACMEKVSVPPGQHAAADCDDSKASKLLAMACDH